MKTLIAVCSVLMISSFMSNAFAAQTDVKFYTVLKGDSGKYIGKVHLEDTQYGLLISPDLKQLPSGLHGFHVHVNASCADNGMAAGGHLDPTHTGKHLGPYSAHGHLGDLPVLYVTKNGLADVPTLAPRLTVKQVEGHSIMIHMNGDNYSDVPAKLGGGGARLACGVVK